MSASQTQVLLGQLSKGVQSDLENEFLAMPEGAALQSITYRIEDYTSWLLMGSWPEDIEKLAARLESAHQIDLAPLALRRELTKLLRGIYVRLQSSWPKIQARHKDRSKR